MTVDEEVGLHFSKPTMTIGHNETVGYTIREMIKHRYRRFPVLNEENNPVGMITSTDILGLMYYNPDASFMKIPVETIMSKKIIIVDATDSIRSCVKLMYNIGITGLPILKEDKIVGMFTEKDCIIKDSLWTEIPDSEILSNEGIGSVVNENTVVTTDFTFWQVAERLVNLAQRQVLVKEERSNSYSGIITIRSLLRAIVDVLTLSSEDDLSSLQKLKVSSGISSLPMFQRAAPTVVSSARLWLNSRGIEAFPLYSSGRPCKLISEKDLLGYLAINI